MLAALAAVPILVVLGAMAGLGLPAAAAGALGLAAGAAVAVAAFGFGAEAPGPAAALAGTAAEAATAAAAILWIVLPALALHELQTRAGALDRMRGALAALSADRGVQALLIAWFFGLFLEGAAGFGTPVALAAPLLVGLGVPPVRAVAAALVGHAAGVAFGALGTPVLAQAAETGLAPQALAAATAALTAVPAAALALLVARLAGGRGHRAALAAAAAFLVPMLALAAAAGPELATLGGALAGGAAFAAALGRRARAPHARRPGSAGSAGADGDARRGADASRAPRPAAADLAPYAAVLLLVLLTRLVPLLREALAGATLGWALPGGFGATVAPLFHPGTLLAAGLLLSAGLTGRAGLLRPAFAAALARLLPVAAALFLMLALARLMVHAGLIAELARTAAAAGPAWPILAPFVGVLGSFVTGSATASNILFSGFQVETAAALGLPPVVMAAAQGVGAAVGNAVAPHNVIAGAATVGLRGREGQVLRLTVGPVLLYALAAGALVALAIRLG